MRLKLILFLVLACFVLAATAGSAHDGSVTWEFFTMDEKIDLHEDDEPWKGYFTATVKNSTNIDWGDFHFRIIGQDVTGVLIADDPAPTMTWPSQFYTHNIWTDANGNGALDYYFYDLPVEPGDSVTFVFYTDNTANKNALFGVSGMPTPVPEPSSLLAMSGGLLGIAGYALRRRR